MEKSIENAKNFYNDLADLLEKYNASFNANTLYMYANQFMLSMDVILDNKDRFFLAEHVLGSWETPKIRFDPEYLRGLATGEMLEQYLD